MLRSLQRPDPIAPGSEAEGFLAALARPDRPAIDARHALLVVAHPDDETIGLGAQLHRLQGLTLVHVTDGAPRGGADAAAHGFSSPEAYAAARRRELDAALAGTGIGPDRRVALDIPDQGTVDRLPEIARRLAALMRERGTRLVITHACEGGHPDHDACAVAAWAASRLVAGVPPAILEMPFYSLAPDGGWRIGRFADEAGPETVLLLDDDERRRKRAMLDAHRSQAAVLSRFQPCEERLRPAPPRDLSRLPNGGALLYERHRWGMTGARWSAAVADALAALGLEDAP